jgi:hypothetical protein
VCTIELLSEFGRSVNVFISSLVKCFEIPRDVLRNIYSEFDQITSLVRPKEEYFDIIDRFVALLENTVRKYLLVSCLLIFGPYHSRIKHYPEDVRKYIIGAVPSSTSYEAYNEFENLNRGQYRVLFTGIGRNSDLYRLIIDPIVRDWDSRDLNSFFRLFGDINIITSHLKGQTIEDIRKDIPTFFRLSCRLVAALASRARGLLTDNNVIVSNENRTFVVFGCISEKNKGARMIRIQDAPDTYLSHFGHEIGNILEEDFIHKILDNSDNIKGDIEMDIMDIEANRIKYGMNYCESMPLIAYLLATHKIRAITLYGTNICLRRV